MTGLGDTIAQTTQLWPHLATALARDTAIADGPGATGFTAATVVNADVLNAMLTLGRDVPAVTRQACDAISEPWQHRELTDCLRQIPRLASRMHDLGMASEERWVAEQATAWLRITKRALGLRKPDVPIGYACPWADGHDGPAGLISAGDEGFLKPGEDGRGQRVEWVSQAQIYCPSCGASWGPAQWPLLGRMLATADGMARPDAARHDQARHSAA